MSTSEMEQKATLSRQEVARWLAELARALADGGEVPVGLTGRSSVTVVLPDELRCEIEIEDDGDEGELEIELSWRSGEDAV